MVVRWTIVAGMAALLLAAAAASPPPSTGATPPERVCDAAEPTGSIVWVGEPINQYLSEAPRVGSDGPPDYTLEGVPYWVVPQLEAGRGGGGRDFVVQRELADCLFGDP